MRWHGELYLCYNEITDFVSFHAFDPHFSEGCMKSLTSKEIQRLRSHQMQSHSPSAVLFVVPFPLEYAKDAKGAGCGQPMRRSVRGKRFEGERIKCNEL